MVVETLWPETAPWWLNLFIWMATFWWYILVGFVPAFYIAIAKLFGMPLLQRWANEVVIVLYPTKVKFAKITQQSDPYFRYKKGIYWRGNPLQPDSHFEISPKWQAKLDKNKEIYEILTKKENRTKKEERQLKSLLRQQVRIERNILAVNPVNQIHIYTHAVNQPVYDMERRESKIQEILNNSAKPKKIAGHGVWLMQNPKLHFHRHYQLFIDPQATMYKLIPVKTRQQFSIGFWHSIGIILQKYEEKEEVQEISAGSSGGKQLVQTLITNHAVLQQIKHVQEFQNYSAARAYMLLKRRAKVEDSFMMWVKGEIHPLIWIVLIGAVASIAMIFLFSHGSGGATPPPPNGVHQIL